MLRHSACVSCRSRKVKCDRLLPTCSTCCRLNRECVAPARSPEITWLHADTVGEGAPDEHHQYEHQQRQHGAKSLPLLSEGERARHVATILSAIQDVSVETLLTDLDIRTRDFEVGDTATLGPFSVFQLPGATEIAEQDIEAIEIQYQDSPSTSLILDAFPMNNTLDNENRVSILDESPLHLSLPDQQLLNPSLDAADDDDLCTHLLDDRSVFEDLILPSDGFSFIIPPGMPISYSFNVNDLDFPTIRLLLDRYQHGLVPCFSPARIHSKSPWETLHIPKVYETLGEFMVTGDAGNSKVSLFFAVLGASAFHLDILSPSSNDGSVPWKIIGDRYRIQAKSRLKTCLQSLSSGRKQEDYDDVLMALLSMVTLCVVSGDMEETYAYLRDIEHLIALYGVNEIRKSPGVRMLHSTFLYLRTLQASVGIFGTQSQASVNGHLKVLEEVENVFVLSDQNANLWSSLLPADGNFDVSTMLTATTSPPCHICGRNKSIFERIYSLPEPLFQLISRVTTLAQRMEILRRSQWGSTDPDHDLLSADASQLETDICDWRNDIANPDQESVLTLCSLCIAEEESDPTQEKTDGRSRVSLLYHFREAMHAALLIYFYRCVRNVDTHILQQFVDKTFDHLTRYGEYKRKSNDPSSNLCWPGFIAGCEASNRDTRDKISAWFSSETALTGIRMFEVAGQAVKQVWEARDLARNRNLP
ncbi:arginine metabolism regulation protein II [Ilyonectria robusta]|uniref:arginine metabolism regulation protein II n=1 Tax=Ilyonectria robusta TaxID=1079257 RepID=UPI001E8E4B8B|nr:arginine metabolism regulation protein II [Ilyonectria robusta]KAH8666072.1 arginine metabolism regulation protein II [Ilyonectria robusta]